MAAGCDSSTVEGRSQRAARAGKHPRLSLRTTSRIAGSLTAAGLALSLGLPALAASSDPVTSPTPAFSAGLALPGETGATSPTAVIDGNGALLVLGTTSPGAGCPVASVSPDGATAHFLGRTPGGLGCAAAFGSQPSSLAFAAQSPDGTVAGRSADGGASFTWSDASGPKAMGSMAADPQTNSLGLATLYLLVRDPSSGQPRIAVSTDGGQTYAFGSPLINATDVDPGLSEGLGPAPLAGNLVARRDSSGLRLYAVLETADSAADRIAQAAAGTTNLNRVYEAVGTVTPAASVGAAPTVAWHDVEAYAAPAGTGLNRALPSTAVDSAGRVYVAFADGRHTYVKSDFDGLSWDPTSPAVAVDAVATGLPSALTASLQPALTAGGNGKTDVVWYAASGGAAGSKTPTAGAANVWNVYMAQTLDGGQTWAASQVSDQPVHQGALCVTADTVCAAGQPGGPAPSTDAVQAAADPASGALAVAYAADQATPGQPSLFAARQCTGDSVLTGQPLVNVCTASQPASPGLPGTSPPCTGTTCASTAQGNAPATAVAGSSCPGPQVTDVPGDAIDNSPAGNGANVPALDLTTAKFGSLDPATVQVTIAVNALSAQLPADVSQAWWRLTWTSNAVAYYAQATMPAGQPPAYSVGTVNPDGTLAVGQPAVGSFTPGNSGQITINLPLASIGNAPSGASFTNLVAATDALYVVGGAVASGPQLVDRAPDAGAGASYAVAQACPPDAQVPEIPSAALLPVAAGAAGLLVTFTRRRRSRRTLEQSASSEGGLTP